MMVEEEVQIERKLELLKLAEQLGSVSAACRSLGVSRDTFYRARQAFAGGGLPALKNISRKKPNLKNRVSAETENAVIQLSQQRPSYGQARIAKELTKQGIRISPAGVRCVWQRHQMETTTQRRAKAEEQSPSFASSIEKFR